MNILFDEISAELQTHYFAFAKFWERAGFVFDDKAKSISLTTDKVTKEIVLRINPKFWDDSSIQEKVFAVCHEAAHLVYGHHWRILNLKNQEIANIAADLVVNETLKNDFVVNFDEFLIKPCFLESYLPDAPTNETLEYYYEKLLEEQPNQANDSNDNKSKDKESDQNSDDDSDAENNSSSGNEKSEQQSGSDNLSELDLSAVEEIANSLDEGEKKEVVKMAGDGEGNAFIDLATKKKIKRKKKWETVIKKWTEKCLSDFAEAPNWTKEHKRASLLMKDCLLPFDDEDEEMQKNRIDLVFFMDTSGSCISLADRFFKAAASLDPKKFNIKLFCFDTRIYEVSLKNPKAMGGGGTYFDILEKHLQKMEKYPSAVFMITDGFGDNIKPEYPNRWHVFLTRDGSTRCFPSGTNFHALSDFE